MTLLKTNSEVPRMAPVSIMSEYVTAIEASASADSTPYDQSSIAEGRTTLERERDGATGTTIVLSCVYDVDTTAIGTQPVVVLLGRYDDGEGNEEPWRVLRNKAGDTAVEISCSVTTDAFDATYFYSSPDLEVQSWDTLGCNRFKFAYATLGVFTTAAIPHYFEAKIL
jgi:hypothetical protein